MKTDFCYTVLDIPCVLKTSIFEVVEHFQHVFEYLERKPGFSADTFVLELIRNEEWYCIRCDGEEYSRHKKLLQALLELEFLACQIPLKRAVAIILFHAAWLSKGEQSLLLLGQGGCGKSSLAFELLKNGWAFGSDEWTCLHEGGSFIPFPRKILLKKGNPLITRYSLESWDKNLLNKLDGRIYANIAEGGKIAKQGCYEPVFIFLKKKLVGPLVTTPLATLDTLGKMVALCPERKKINEKHFKVLAGFPKSGSTFFLEYASIDEVKRRIFELTDI